MTRREMDAVEIADYLEECTAGVLAMASDDAAYAIPLSFTFHPDEAALYFELRYGPDSRKRRFVDDSERATFVVFDQSGDGWRSVVATGSLSIVADDGLDAAIEEAVRGLSIPWYDVHDRPIAELEVAIVRLAVDQLTGIAEG